MATSEAVSPFGNGGTTLDWSFVADIVPKFISLSEWTDDLWIGAVPPPDQTGATLTIGHTLGRVTICPRRQRWGEILMSPRFPTWGTRGIVMSEGSDATAQALTICAAR